MSDKKEKSKVHHPTIIFRLRDLSCKIEILGEMDVILQANAYAASLNKMGIPTRLEVKQPEKKVPEPPKQKKDEKKVAENTKNLDENKDKNTDKVPEKV